MVENNGKAETEEEKEEKASIRIVTTTATITKIPGIAIRLL